jgi:predicted CXXCH cytochrome family protein
MTWYRSADELRLTPGHEGLAPVEPAERFGRLLQGEHTQRCIRCHTTTGRITGARLVGLDAGVQCEACHGPGARHVEAARAAASGAASRIRARWNAAEETALCGRCHRLPSDIAPERLRSYPKSLVRFQPVGLLQSRCYQESGGMLKCTTCHDPHRGIETRSAEAQAALCLACHQQEQQTRCPVSATADCIRCHMPSVEVMPTVMFHDHWIRVHRGGTEPPADDDLSVDEHSAPAGRGAQREGRDQ